MRYASAVRFLDDARADLRYAVRALLRSPAFAVTAIVILALGIGANTALFNAVKGLLLDPLAVADPAGLVRLRWTGEHQVAGRSSEYGYTADTIAGLEARSTFSYPTFERFRADNDTLAGLFASAPVGLNVVIGEEAEVASGLLVSAGYYDVLGVRARIGRALGPEDDQATATPAAVISHPFWVRRFAGDPAVVGAVISVNGVAVTIVGVLPDTYAGVQRPGATAADVHLPLALHARFLPGGDRTADARSWWLQIMGRLLPVATAEQVLGDLGGVFQAEIDAGMDAVLAKLGPEARQIWADRDPAKAPRLLVDSGSRGIYDPEPRVTRQSTILGVVVALILLVVCTNVANLLLSRATSRRREIALRRSVGATRGRVVRQLVTEGVVLSALGGALGLLVALVGRRWLPFGRETPFDLRLLAFVAILSLSTGLAFSVVPALRATGVDTAGALREGSRSVVRSRSLLASALLVVQVAVSVVVLVGAGLFLQTLANLRRVDVGFDPENVLLFRMDPRSSGYDDERKAAVYDRIADGLRAVPGVRSVSLSSVAFLTNSVWKSSIHVEGEGHEAHMNMVSPEFFATMRIPLVAGRVFDERDRTNAPPVAIVNQTAAREYFGDRDPVGRRMGSSHESDAEIEVVGVVRDVKYNDLRVAAPPTVYQPHAQRPEGGGRVFSVKTAVLPSSVMPAVREAVRRVDPNLPLMYVTTQESEIEKRLAQERLLAFAYSLFGGLAMLLASIGLYGLASYGVVQRTNEIGIRMALGAQAADVTRMIARESMALVGVGVAVGVAGALAAGRLVESLLYELAPTDGLTMVQAAAAMVAVAAVAAYLPARRAARVDPLVALRCE